MLRRSRMVSRLQRKHLLLELQNASTPTLAKSFPIVVLTQSHTHLSKFSFVRNTVGARSDSVSPWSTADHQKDSDTCRIRSTTLPPIRQARSASIALIVQHESQHNAGYSDASARCPFCAPAAVSEGYKS
ncbi:guanine nucleotide exchange factor [Pseudozyma hubeiensis SY62]|uniref:Guanine nucleotide exchange factor n=1 Tax=Pseudozyma hubeiensis (strain SY62) TaxID=1305764 RepID=R9PA94_PSEHS|nr:guanine nucleotide exchange factor [Pseudozyma hubeiensis SY62]GAC98177.1 guanine nucleotide exchange factor [Pseudozyma hubeiensis SY62]